MKTILLCLCLSLGYACQAPNDKNGEATSSKTQLTPPTTPQSTLQFSQDSMAAIFKELNLEGTFVVKTLGTSELTIYNEQRARTAFLPASTFKIPNSLIALENQAVKDDQEVIPWDGTTRAFEAWNQDHNLRSALKYSCVWFYQELARRVGEKKMREYLKIMQYGNDDLSAGIDLFWLTGNFAISAVAQINFLEAFYQEQFPFASRHFSMVKNAMLVEQGKRYRLHAKTGWSGNTVDPQIAWYVGYLLYDQQVYLFALNIVPTQNEELRARQIIPKRIFKSAGLRFE